MKERPILFSGAMVRAILGGRKTQTRRVIKPQPAATERGRPWCSMEDLLARCPYGQPGDELWVRETFAYIDEKHVIYRASEGIEVEEVLGRKLHSYKPSIHMPRWASRIQLRVTGVRVERVQEITDEDVVAEGIDIGKAPYPEDQPMLRDFDVDFETAFRDLWDSINAKRGYSWKSNPWVWVVTFAKISLDNPAGL